MVEDINWEKIDNSSPEELQRAIAKWIGEVNENQRIMVKLLIQIINILNESPTISEDAWA